MRRRLAVVAAAVVLVVGVAAAGTIVVAHVFCWDLSDPVLCRLAGPATVGDQAASGGSTIAAGAVLQVPAGSEAQVVLPPGFDPGLLLARSRGSTVELTGPSTAKFLRGRELFLLGGHAQVHYQSQQPFTVVGGVGVVRLSSPAVFALDESAGFRGNLPALSVQVTSGVVRANSTESGGSLLLHGGDSTTLTLQAGH